MTKPLTKITQIRVVLDIFTSEGVKTKVFFSGGDFNSSERRIEGLEYILRDMFQELEADMYFFGFPQTTNNIIANSL